MSRWSCWKAGCDTATPTERGTGAIAYEEMMGRWRARLAPLFANFAKITDGGRVLDVGCGTGALVRTVVGMTRQAEIVGIDPVQPVIEYARARCTDARVTFDRGNALDLPYPAASFMHTLSLLVLMFIPHPEKAAHEMRRVTRPGGTVAVCESVGSARRRAERAMRAATAAQQ